MDKAKSSTASKLRKAKTLGQIGDFPLLGSQSIRTNGLTLSRDAFFKTGLNEKLEFGNRGAVGGALSYAGLSPHGKTWDKSKKYVWCCDIYDS